MEKQKVRTVLVFWVMVIVILSPISFASNHSESGGIGAQSVVPGTVVVSSHQEQTSFSVDPFLNRQTEPAPMGIADYGLGYNGVPYNYTTTSFLGITNIDSLSTYNSSSYVLGNMTFQLNLNLVFTYQGVNYVYWVQDVAYLNTSNNQVLFLDNIWNLSSQNAAMYNSTVVGGGTVTTSGNTAFYYDFAGSTLKGNNVTLTYPATLSMKMNATRSSSGMPEVEFLYNDGMGWVVYDRAIFHFVTKPTSTPLFWVDGYAYNPYGVYYDAELIMGGPGNSSQTGVLNSTVYLTLQYYNGHNYQSIQNAYNFGSDTAESVYNAVSTGVYNTTYGQVSASVTGGSGTLGLIYYANQLSTLRVITNIRHGAVYINETNVTGFSNGLVNLTLGPGTYSLKLYNYSSDSFSILGNVTLIAGQEYSVSNDVYYVEFRESGLSVGDWYLNVSGIESGPITGSQYSLDLQNGTYNYTIYTSNKDYRALNSSGSFVVNGSALKLNLSFVPILFNVSFVESGLPSGTVWSVTLNGKGTVSSKNATIAFSLTNGTYDYLIPRVIEYAPPSSTGSVTVDGKDVVLTLPFAVLDGYLTGKIRPLNATISVNGTLYKASNGIYNISLEPGNYSVKISAPGYLTYSTNVTITSTNVTHIQASSLLKESNYSLLIEIVIFSLLFVGGIWSLVWSKRRR